MPDALPGVTFEVPDRMSRDGVSIVAGEVTWTLLHRLVLHGPSRIADVKHWLWQDGEAPDNRLKRAVSRANGCLKLLGVQVRVRFDCGNLLLL